MSLGLLDYRRHHEKCLANADRCFGDAATIWRELASSYRLLIDIEERESREKMERAQIAEQ